MIAIEDKIILEALEPEKLTSGGVILPDTSTEASDRGKVLHVGPGRQAVSGGEVGNIVNSANTGETVGLIFYDQGTVSADLGRNLWTNFKDTYGMGLRFITGSTVFRFDYGNSDEGSQTIIYYDYPFYWKVCTITLCA